MNEAQSAHARLAIRRAPIAVRQGETREPLLCKTVSACRRFFDRESLAIGFVLSTPDVDRDGDRLALDGWELENYRRNPVVLWAHDQSRPPVARASEIAVASGALTAVATFTPKEVNPFGHMTFQLYAEGFLNAVSVGFLPRQWRWAEPESPEAAGLRAGGMDFLRQELVEFSCVPVPSNPQALLAARAKGIDMLPLVRWAEATIDEPEQRVLERSALEELRRAALGLEARAPRLAVARWKGLPTASLAKEGEEMTDHHDAPIQAEADEAWRACADCENSTVCEAAQGCYLGRAAAGPPEPAERPQLDPPLTLEIAPETAAAAEELPSAEEIAELVEETLAAALAPLGLSRT